MNKSLVVRLFYTGTLLSSIGSFSFNIALIAFMLKNNFSLSEVGLIIGLQRFVPVAVIAVWGQWTDRFSAKGVIAVAESVAAVCSLLMFTLWSGAHTSYVALAGLCIFRAIVVSFQTGSRAKVTKYLGEDTFRENAKHSIWFNKATQGATLFAGLVAWVIIRYFNLETAIIVDGITFALNGVIALMVRKRAIGTMIDFSGEQV
jgi:MFS family permease